MRTAACMLAIALTTLAATAHAQPSWPLPGQSWPSPLPDVRDSATFLHPFNSAREGDVRRFERDLAGALTARICDQESGECEDATVTGRDATYIAAWRSVFTGPARLFTIAFGLRDVAGGAPILLGSRRFCAVTPGAGQGRAIYCGGRRRAPAVRIGRGGNVSFRLHVAIHPLVRARRLALTGVEAGTAARHIDRELPLSVLELMKVLRDGYGIGPPGIAKALVEVPHLRAAGPSTIGRLMQRGLGLDATSVAAALRRGLGLSPAELVDVLGGLGQKPEQMVSVLHSDAVRLTVADVVTGLRSRYSLLETASALYEAGIAEDTIVRAFDMARIRRADIFGVLLGRGYGFAGAARITAEVLSSPTAELLTLIRLNDGSALDALRALPAFADRSPALARASADALLKAGYTPAQMGSGVSRHYSLSYSQHLAAMLDVLPDEQVHSAVDAGFPQRVRSFALTINRLPAQRFARILSGVRAGDDRRGMIVAGELLARLGPPVPVPKFASVEQSLVDPTGALQFMHLQMKADVADYIGMARLTTNPPLETLARAISVEYSGTEIAATIDHMCSNATYVRRGDPDQDGSVRVPRALAAEIAKAVRRMRIGVIDLARGLDRCGWSRSTIYGAMSSAGYRDFARAFAVDSVGASLDELLDLLDPRFREGAKRANANPVRTHMAREAARVLDYVLHNRRTRRVGIFYVPSPGLWGRADMHLMLRRRYRIPTPDFARLLYNRGYCRDQARRALREARIPESEIAPAIRNVYLRRNCRGEELDEDEINRDSTVLIVGGWGDDPVEDNI